MNTLTTLGLFVLAVVILIAWMNRRNNEDTENGPFWLIGYRSADDAPILLYDGESLHSAQAMLQGYLVQGRRCGYHTIELKGKSIEPCRYYPGEHDRTGSRVFTWIIVLIVLVFVGLWYLHH